MDTKLTQSPPCIKVPCIIFPKKEWNLPEQRLHIKAGYNVKFCYEMEDATVPWKTVLGRVKSDIYVVLEKWLKTKMLLTVEI